MVPKIDTDDLIDARGVAKILGLANRTSVGVYQRRYPEMPRPVVDLGPSRPHLWSRNAVVTWYEDARLASLFGYEPDRSAVELSTEEGQKRFYCFRKLETGGRHVLVMEFKVQQFLEQLHWVPNAARKVDGGYMVPVERWERETGRIK